MADKTRTRPSSSMLRTALLGLVAGIVTVDTLLLVAKPGAWVAEPVRILLAVGALGVIPLAFRLGADSPKYAVVALLSTPVAVVYAYTGLLLPWTELSFVIGQHGIEMLLGVPFIGEWLALGMFGGFTLTESYLRMVFRNHYAIVALAALALVAVGVVSTQRGLAPRSE